MAISKETLTRDLLAKEEPPAEGPEYEQVAGLSDTLSRAATKAIMGGLTKKGARAVDYTVAPENKKPPVSTEAIVEPELPPGPTPSTTDEAAVPPRPDLTPASEADADGLVQAREAAEATPRMVPSPTPAQQAAGLEQGPVNTRFYDEESLASTVEAVAVSTPDVQKPKTIQELYDRASVSGVPTQILKSLFEGEPMTSPVGGSQLAEQLAGLQMLHDVSALRLDALLNRARNNELDAAGKLELRETMAQHNIIYQKMKGAKTDVARAMNVFKGANNMMGEDDAAGLNAALDQMGGDFDLAAFADNYLSHNNPGKKNRLLEATFWGKGFDAIVYTNQSLLLTNPDTHVYNAIANGVSLLADGPEKILATGIGATRIKLAEMLGRDTNPDQYFVDDVINSYSGVLNGIQDAWIMMGRELKDGTGAKDARVNPVSSENLAGSTLGTFRGKVLQTPELGESATADAIYRAVDMYGKVLNIPMTGLGVADKGFVGLAQRMQLHEEAGRLGRDTYNAALNGGATHAQALEDAQKSATRLLSERPADIDASVDDFTKRITLQGQVTRDTAMGKFIRGFQSVTTKSAARPLLRPMMLFTQSVSNLAIEGLARVPIAGVLSPRFKSEFNKGGRHRDLALGRMAFGGMLMTGGAYLAYNGRMTGPGPTDTEDKRALKARGWMPYAASFGSEEIAGGNVSRLKDMLGEEYVTTGTGENEGKVYVSLKRLEPFTMPILMGATLGDTLKYQVYDEDEEGTLGSYLETMGNATMAVGAEYTTNMPQMSAISDIMSILNQRQTDGGDRLIGAVDAYLRMQGEFYMRGATPGINLTNSAIAGKIESMIDPHASNTDPTSEQSRATEELLGIKGTAPAVRSFWTAYNKWMSRVPVMSEGVPVRLDAYGNEVGSQRYLPAAPTRMTEGPRDNDGNLMQDEYFQILAMVGHGISEPPKDINGVRLTADQQNRYIEIYTTHRINGRDFKEETLKNIKEYMKVQQRNNNPAYRGDIQDIYNDTVGEFRAVAKKKMFGKIEYNDRYDIFEVDTVNAEERRTSREMVDVMRKKKRVGR